MKAQFKLYRRDRLLHCEDCVTGEQVRLRTADRTEAETLIHARNEARQPMLNLQTARTYIRAGGPETAPRCWQTAMDEMGKTKTDVALHRHHRANRTVRLEGRH